MMKNKLNIYIPPEGPPEDGRPSKEIYLKMGEENIFKMIEDFYLRLEKSEIRPLFPSDMAEASKKSALFFVFLLGGPPLYQQRYGHPMMRQRHLAFAIDEAVRKTWLDCFRKSLDFAVKNYRFPVEHLEEVDRFIDRFSKWMVNTT